MPRKARQFVDLNQKDTATAATARGHIKAGAGAEIVSLESVGVDLDFSDRKRFSVYDELLEKLLDSPKGSALKVSNLKARHSIRQRAKKKNLKVEFAELDGTLYVRIVPDKIERTVAAVTVAEKRVLEALEKAPETAVIMARNLSLGVPAVRGALTQLVSRGQVQVDAGGLGAPVYRLVAEKK